MNCLNTNNKLKTAQTVSLNYNDTEQISRNIWNSIGCGGGYLLTVLGLCNQDSISLLYGSDINENMVECAKKNLSLVSLQGINFRIQELVVVRSKYQKEVHQKAYESAMALKEIIIREITTEIFCADATQRISIPEKADIMIADVPYGKTVSWHGDENSLNHMMDQLANVASENCILAVSMDKSQRPRSNHWKRLEK